MFIGYLQLINTDQRNSGGQTCCILYLPGQEHIFILKAVFCYMYIFFLLLCLSLFRIWKCVFLPRPCIFMNNLIIEECLQQNVQPKMYLLFTRLNRKPLEFSGQCYKTLESFNKSYTYSLFGPIYCTHVYCVYCNGHHFHLPSKHPQLSLMERQTSYFFFFFSNVNEET